MGEKKAFKRGGGVAAPKCVTLGGKVRGVKKIKKCRREGRRRRRPLGLKDKLKAQGAGGL